MNYSYYNRNRSMRQRTYTANMYRNDCPCQETARTTRSMDCSDMALAMAYVPVQKLDTLYEPDAAFSEGTLFPELNKPLMVGGTVCG